MIVAAASSAYPHQCCRRAAAGLARWLSVRAIQRIGADAASVAIAHRAEPTTGGGTHGFEGTRNSHLPAFHRSWRWRSCSRNFSARPFRCSAARRRNSTACLPPTSCSCSAASCAGFRTHPNRAQTPRGKYCVPFCRAAKGALAKPGCQRLYLAMEKRPALRKRLVKLRAQRWSREVLLAALLTIAAVAFIAAAMVSTDQSDQAKSSIETALTATLELCAVVITGISRTRNIAGPRVPNFRAGHVTLACRIFRLPRNSGMTTTLASVRSAVARYCAVQPPSML